MFGNQRAASLNKNGELSVFLSAVGYHCLVLLHLLPHIPFEETNRLWVICVV